MKKNESGRSMVEMLGVLAIVGVLSIGGIAGYNLAINRYRANEILDATMKVATVAASANGGLGGSATLKDIGGYQTAGVPLVTNDNAISCQRTKDEGENDMTGCVIQLGPSPSPQVVKAVKQLAGNMVEETPLGDSVIFIVIKDK